MAAERLYYDAPALDARALEFTAAVTDIRLDSVAKADGKADGAAAGQLWQLALDRTAFYPTGGGQPHDLGTLTATSRGGVVLHVAVERVEEDEAGEVWHYVRKPLLQGAQVVGRVDADRRLDLAQQHSGQHLLSAVFLRELAAPTVSFHLGADRIADRVTIDLAVPSVSDDDLRRIEQIVNREAAANHVIRPLWVTREEAEAMLARGELRKLPGRAGPMRIVTMEGIEHNACGGTHVAATGAIGCVLLRRTEKVKQGTRVEFCCGLRTVAVARRDLDVLRQAGALLSVGAADVPDRVARLLEDKKAAAKELKSLQRRLAPQQPQRQNG